MLDITELDDFPIDNEQYMTNVSEIERDRMLEHSDVQQSEALGLNPRLEDLEGDGSGNDGATSGKSRTQLPLEGHVSYSG